jgi:hypothetical protein
MIRAVPLGLAESLTVWHDKLPLGGTLSGSPKGVCRFDSRNCQTLGVPRQSRGFTMIKSVDSRPPPGAAGGVAHPRRCPRPLLHRPGPALRRLGGRRGHCRRLAGGGPCPRGPRPSRRTDLPPFAHDGTERRIVRPQDPAEQTDCYSGKKKDHTVKNVLLVNALLIILFLSDTYGGRVHDKRIADATPYPLPARSRLLQDLGFLAFTLPEVEILMPTKKPRGEELTLEQHVANQVLNQRRLRIEHVNSSCHLTHKSATWAKICVKNAKWRIYASNSR